MSPAVELVELESDEGLFVIRGGVVSLPSDLGPGVSQLVEIGPDTQNEAWVLTTDQWGPFSVLVRRARQRTPVNPRADHVVEFSVSCHDGGLVVDELLGEGRGVPLAAGAGVFRVRVSGRNPGLHSGGEHEESASGQVPVEGSMTTPSSGEHYLVEAWPEPVSSSTVLSRPTPAGDGARPTGPASSPSVEESEALVASAAIGRDVAGAEHSRKLSGEVSSVQTQRLIHASPSVLFPLMRHAVPLSGRDWSSMGGESHPGEVPATTYGASGSSPDQLSGGAGVLRNTVVEEDPPLRCVREWNWHPPQWGVLPWSRPLFLAKDTIVETTYTPVTDADLAAGTLVTVTHTQVPVEWVADLTAWWTFQLTLLDRAVGALSDAVLKPGRDG